MVIAVAAAVLNTATPTASTAQDTATGAVVVPGPEPVDLPGPTRRILDRVQVDLGYTYDDATAAGPMR